MASIILTPEQRAEIGHELSLHRKAYKSGNSGMVIGQALDLVDGDVEFVCTYIPQKIAEQIVGLIDEYIKDNTKSK